MRYGWTFAVLGWLGCCGSALHAQGAPPAPSRAELAFEACAYHSALNHLSFRNNPSFFRTLLQKDCAREIEELGRSRPGEAGVPADAVERIVADYQRTLVNMRQGSF